MKWVILQSGLDCAGAGLFFNPFDGGVGGAGGIGVVIVCHETKVIDVDVWTEECLRIRKGNCWGDLGGRVSRHMGWDDDDDTFFSLEKVQRIR